MERLLPAMVSIIPSPGVSVDAAEIALEGSIIGLFILCETVRRGGRRDMGAAVSEAELVEVTSFESPALSHVEAVVTATIFWPPPVFSGGESPSCLLKIRDITCFSLIDMPAKTSNRWKKPLMGSTSKEAMVVP